MKLIRRVTIPVLTLCLILFYGGIAACLADGNAAASAKKAETTAKTKKDAGKVSLEKLDVKWNERQTKWHGFQRVHFSIEGHRAHLVLPQKALPGNPWIWRARFPNFHADADIQLLKRGFHVAYLDMPNMFGSPRAVALGDKFYAFLVTKQGLAKKVVLEGVSRGGLFVYNWGTKNPECIACIYADTPVCDFKSWPAGRGKGKFHAASWKLCLAEYGFTEKEALAYKKNPIDKLAPLVKYHIPILHIVSESDRIVPPKENTYLLQKRLEALGGKMEVISVAQGTKASCGHHFKHPAIDRVVRFIAEHGVVQEPPKAKVKAETKK